MSDDLTEPISIEQSEIASDLNSFVLYAFLMGTYTLVYFCTLYAYVTKRTNQRCIVISTITTLYLLGSLEFGVQWYLTYWQFVKYGETRDTIYAQIFNIPAWSAFMIIFNPLFSIVLADGLLLWRCFHVWNGSIRVMALPSFFMFLEVASFMVGIILRGRYTLPGTTLLSEQQIALVNAVVSAQLFLSVAASLVITSLIVFRIQSVSQENGGSVRRFKNILDTVVQSSAVYSLAMMVEAITFVLPDAGEIDNTRTFALNCWVDNLISIISGMVPTIMVARIILTRPNNARVSTIQLNLSGLHFERQSTINPRETGMASFDMIDIPRDSSSVFDIEDKKAMV